MGKIAIAPTPNAVYKFEIGITKNPTGLGTSNTTTWVSVNAERALLYACMVETFKIFKSATRSTSLRASLCDSLYKSWLKNSWVKNEETNIEMEVYGLKFLLKTLNRRKLWQYHKQFVMFSNKSF